MSVYRTPAKVADHGESILSKLIDEYREAADQFPVIYGILRAIAWQGQGWEDAAYALLYGRFLSEVNGYGPATNAQLDLLGEIVGEKRVGRLDGDYREAIRLRIRVNRSAGTSRDLIEVVRLAFPVGALSVTSGGGDVNVSTYGLSLSQFRALKTALQETRAAGIRLIFQYTEEAQPLRFAYNGTAGIGYGTFAYSGVGAKMTGSVDK